MYKSLALLIFCIATLTACGGGASGSSDSSSSSSSSSTSSSSSSSSSSSGASAQTSHNAGQHCLSCHTDGGSAPVAFTVAGTIYATGTTPQTNGTVRIYAAGTNTLLATLTTDASGNFYTSESIAGLEVNPATGFKDGVDPEIEGPSGMIRTMPGIITSGSCNGCHGNGNGVLRVN